MPPASSAKRNPRGSSSRCKLTGAAGVLGAKRSGEGRRPVVECIADRRADVVEDGEASEAGRWPRRRSCSRRRRCRSSRTSGGPCVRGSSERSTSCATPCVSRTRTLTSLTLPFGSTMREAAAALSPTGVPSAPELKGRLHHGAGGRREGEGQRERGERGHHARACSPAHAVTVLEDRFGDVEVGVDRVDVVVLVEVSISRISRRASASADLDDVLGLHRELGRLDLDPRLLERGADRGQSEAAVSHLEQVAVLDDVFGAGVDRGDQVVLAVALRVDQDHAALLEHPGDRAGLAEAAAVLVEGVADLGARCGCGCRSAPRRGSRPRRARSPRRGRARSPPRRRPRPCRGRSPAGCCPWASRSRAPSGPRSRASGCRRDLPRPRARRR